ncbi:hypothetical protein [Enterococcus sp. PFB1-1]|uniref:hypothetical protein n=2 Tax=unclassified Enterococcus TaxID=2608891 RepID=UPI002475A3EB|nr:hypothetical protein [Enterococcus sp. PFB1-1]
MFLNANTIVMGVFGVGIYGIFRQLVVEFKRRNDTFEDRFLKLEGATLASLHDKLYHYCEHYLEVGCISIDDFKNLEKLYHGYAGLGGNGMIEKLYERVTQLPIKGGNSNEIE